MTPALWRSMWLTSNGLVALYGLWLAATVSLRGRNLVFIALLVVPAIAAIGLWRGQRFRPAIWTAAVLSVYLLWLSMELPTTVKIFAVMHAAASIQWATALRRGAGPELEPGSSERDARVWGWLTRIPFWFVAAAFVVGCVGAAVAWSAVDPTDEWSGLGVLVLIVFAIALAFGLAVLGLVRFFGARSRIAGGLLGAALALAVLGWMAVVTRVDPWLLPVGIWAVALLVASVALLEKPPTQPSATIPPPTMAARSTT